MRWLRLIRPIEWVLLAFVLVVMAQVGFSAAWRGAWHFAGTRSREVFLALFTVVTLQRVVEAVRGRWRDPQHPLRLKLLVWLVPALLPMLVGLGTGFFDDEMLELVQSGFDAFLVLKIVLVTLEIGGFGAPTLLLWLVLWELARRDEVLRLKQFGDVGRSVLSALRDWVPLLMLISGYTWIGAVMEVTEMHGIDEQLRAADRWIFGVDPVQALEPMIWRPLSTWLAFAYASYAVVFIASPSALWLFGSRSAFREFSLALGIAMAVTWCSYLIFPAKGPVLSQTFAVPLDAYLIEPIKEALMDAGRITWDCFPSMHTCATAIFLWAGWRHFRPLFWAISPVVLSTPFACVYLRYHYVVDVLAGLLLAALAIVVAKWVTARTAAQQAV